MCAPFFSELWENSGILERSTSLSDANSVSKVGPPAVTASDDTMQVVATSSNNSDFNNSCQQQPAKAERLSLLETETRKMHTAGDYYRMMRDSAAAASSNGGAHYGAPPVAAGPPGHHHHHQQQQYPGNLCSSITYFKKRVKEFRKLQLSILDKALIFQTCLVKALNQLFFNCLIFLNPRL